MKTLDILQTVSIPGMPAFKKGMQVRVSDTPREAFGGKSIADVLISRGHAKEAKGKTRDEVRKAKNSAPKADVVVEKQNENGDRSVVKSEADKPNKS